MAVLKYKDPSTGVWYNLASVEKGDPGPPGATGANGTNGTNGTDGVGVPTGGATAQVLTKNSATNYDTKWATPAGTTNLDSLTDVVIAAPTSTQVLAYNGTNWVNAAPTGGSGSGGTGVSAATVVVAARDATAAQRAAADFACPTTLTDDALTIQLAINSVVPSGNSNFSIVLTQGKYQVKSPINLKSGTNLQGMGRDSTILQVHTSFSGAAVIKLNDINVHATELGNFRIDGNNSAGTKVNGIWFNNGPSKSADYTGVPNTDPDACHYIHDIYIRNISGNGICISQTALPTIKDASWNVSDSRESVIYNTIVRNPGEHGYWLHMPDSRFISLGASSAGLNYTDGTDGSVTNPRPDLVVLGSNCRLSTCKVYSGKSHGFYFGKDCDRPQVSNCEAQDCGDYGFLIASKHGVYTGLAADTCGKDTGDHTGTALNAKSAGIYVAGYNNMIQGKVSLRIRTGWSPTFWQYFALNFDSDSMGHGSNVVEVHCQQIMTGDASQVSGLYTGSVSATYARITTDQGGIPRFWLNNSEKTWGVP